MSKNERIELIRSTLADLRKLRRIGPGAAQWGTEADLEYLLACYDSIKAQYDGLIERQNTCRHPGGLTQGRSGAWWCMDCQQMIEPASQSDAKVKHD